MNIDNEDRQLSDEEYLDWLKQETRGAYWLARRMTAAARDMDYLRSMLEGNFDEEGIVLTVAKRKELYEKLKDLVWEWERVRRRCLREDETMGKPNMLMLMTRDSESGEWGYPGDQSACSVETEAEGREALRNLVETCPEYMDCAVLVEERHNQTNSSGRNIGTVYYVLATAAQVCS